MLCMYVTVCVKYANKFNLKKIRETAFFANAKLVTLSTA